MEPANIVLTVIFSVLVVVGVVGNTLVCFVIVHYRDMKNSMNYLLLNLAIADLLTVLFISPQYVFKHAFIHPRGTAGDYLCKFITGGNLSWIGGVVSAITLVAIAIERYYAVMYPHRQSKFTGKVLIITLVMSWVGAFAFNSPLFFVIHYDPNQDFCVEKWPETFHAIIYTCAWFVFVGIFPVLTLVILYSRIVYWLWFRKDDEGVAGVAPERLAVKRVRKKVTKMVIIVSFIYVMCWFPPLTNYLLSYADSDSSFGDLVYVITIVFVTLNSTVNPVIYSFQNERFRKHLKQLVFRRRGRVMPGELQERNQGSRG